jgi:hypothetical protein
VALQKNRYALLKKNEERLLLISLFFTFAPQSTTDCSGGVPERFNGAVLKTVVLKGTGSSNLSSSADSKRNYLFIR